MTRAYVASLADAHSWPRSSHGAASRFLPSAAIVPFISLRFLLYQCARLSLFSLLAISAIIVYNTRGIYFATDCKII